MPVVLEGKDTYATVESSGTNWEVLAQIPRGQGLSAPFSCTGTHRVVIQARRNSGDVDAIGLSKIWSFLVSWRYAIGYEDYDLTDGYTQVGPVIESEPQGDIGTEAWGYEINAGTGEITVGSDEAGADIDWTYTADYVIFWPGDLITITEDIDDSQTTFGVSDTTVLDATHDKILVDDEWMSVIDRDLPGPVGDITVLRAQQGTTPVSHLLGTYIYPIDDDA